MPMKSILAIFAIGLLLATALSGCTGSENNNGTDTTTGTDANGTDTTVENETENQTAGNETAGNDTSETLVVTYHKEETGSADTVSYQIEKVMGFTNFKFPVTDKSEKIIISVTVTGTTPTDNCGFQLCNPSDEEVTVIYVDSGQQGEITVKRSEIAKNGPGDWIIYPVPQIPCIGVDYVLVIDVYGTV